MLCKIILLYQVSLLVEMSRPLAQEAELTHRAITTEFIKIKENSTLGILGISKSRKWTSCNATLHNIQWPSQNFTEL
jgi:hypothetical protein